MVIGNDHVKVTDFGIARILRTGATLNTRTGATMGTPLYMAPEQIEGQKVDGRADIYSFGAVLYQMVTGRPPFEGADPLTIAFKHVHKAPLPPCDINAHLPEEWEGVILKALAKDPKHRFQTVAALEEAIAPLPVAAQPASRPRSHMPREDEAARKDMSEVSLQQEAQTLLDQGRTKELAHDFRGALHDYRAALTVAPSGPLRDELESGVARVTEKMVGVPRAGGPEPSAISQAPDARVERPAAETSPQPSARTEGPVEEAPQSRVSELQVQTSARRFPARPAVLAGGGALLLLVAVGAFFDLSRSGSKSPSTALPPRATAVQPTVPAGTPAGARHFVATIWGSRGSAPGQFIDPLGVAVDSAGNVFVADTGNNRIQMLSSTGRYRRSGLDTRHFSQPYGVAVDAQGDIYVSEGGTNRVDKLSASGKLLARWGGKGSGPGRFDGPGGIAVDAKGNVYVSDIGNNRVQKFSPTGTLLSQYGSTGSGPGQFNKPAGLAVDKNMTLYVGDRNNFRVQKIAKDGAPLAQWGQQGNGPGQFDVVDGVALDSRGNIYVVDSGNNRIQELSPAGRPLAHFGSAGSALGQFMRPEGLAIDFRGNLYVADADNNRIVKLSPTR